MVHGSSDELGGKVGSDACSINDFQSALLLLIKMIDIPYTLASRL